MTSTISADHVESTCKPGTEDCCAYLVMGTNGFECVKLNELKFTIDLRLAEGTMRAIGDNCEGIE